MSAAHKSPQKRLAFASVTHIAQKLRFGHPVYTWQIKKSTGILYGHLFLKVKIVMQKGHLCVKIQGKAIFRVDCGGNLF